MAKSEEVMCEVLLPMFAWAGPTVLRKNIELVDQTMGQLSETRWKQLHAATQAVVAGQHREKPEDGIKPEDVSTPLNERTIVALCQRAKPERSLNWFKEHLSEYNGYDPCVLEFCAGAALGVAIAEPDTWKNWLPIISRCYLHGSSRDGFIGWRFARAMREQVMPIAIAEMIVENAQMYPIELVGFAEEMCTQSVAAKVKPVGLIAKDQKWFG